MRYRKVSGASITYTFRQRPDLGGGYNTKITPLTERDRECDIMHQVPTSFIRFICKALPINSNSHISGNGPALQRKERERGGLPPWGLFGLRGREEGKEKKMLLC